MADGLSRRGDRLLEATVKFATNEPLDVKLLSLAKRGDGDAFGALVAPYRGALQAHCYRMLGSMHDAEDALQEVLTRAWRGLERFEGRSSMRSWMYRIATNVCIDEIARRTSRVLPVDFGPATDPRDGMAAPLAEALWVAPYADRQFDLGAVDPAARYEQREALELAFVATLQLLPALQRAVLILRDVLGFSASDAAEQLDTSVAAVKSALQRARRTVAAQGPAESQQTTLRALGDEQVRKLVEAYVHAFDRNDIDAVVAMLTEDAVLAMPPTPTWFAGREAIALFYASEPMSGTMRWRHIATSANGQPAVAGYTWDRRRRCFVARVLDVLTMRGSQFCSINASSTRRCYPASACPTGSPPERRRSNQRLTAIPLRWHTGHTR